MLDKPFFGKKADMMAVGHREAPQEIKKFILKAAGIGSRDKKMAVIFKQ